MIEVSVTEFRKDLKKYARMVKTEDVVVMNNGKPIMRITDPTYSKVEKVLKLRGIAKTQRDYEEILKERINEL